MAGKRAAGSKISKDRPDASSSDEENPRPVKTLSSERK